jgi:hypothetical protein
MFAFGRRLVRNRTTTTTRTEIKSFVFPFYFSPLYPVYFFFSVSSTPFSFSASLKCSKGFSDAGEDLSCLYNILEINSRFPPFQIASVSVECEAKNKQIRRKTGGGVGGIRREHWYDMHPHAAKESGQSPSIIVHSTRRQQKNTELKK